MHYLIDGHNLIGKVPGISLADPDDEMQLVLLLRQWVTGGSRRRRHQATIYFDGGVVGGRSARLSAGAMKVVFAAPGETADALIIRHLKTIGRPAGFMLVTSDRQIIKEAEFRRVPFILAEEFVEKELGLVEPPPAATPPAEPPSPPSEKPEEVSDREVAEWLDLFGPVPERPPQPHRPRKAPPAAEVLPPPPRPTGLTVSKSENVHLSPEEVAEWEKLFGPEPEHKPPAKAVPKTAKPTPPGDKTRSATRKTPKSADPRLSPEDLEEWLRYLGEDH